MADGIAPATSRAWRSALAIALGVALPVDAAPAEQTRPAARRPCAAPEADSSGLLLDRDLGGGRRLCVRADPEVRIGGDAGTLLEVPEGRRLAIAVVDGAGSRWLQVRRVDGATLYAWEVDGRPAPFDDPARAWMEDAVAVVAGIREGDGVRAEAERLQAEIASLVDSERRLRGEIGALLEERGRLQREIGGIRAEERELRRRMAAVRGEESALRVAAGDHRAAIASLNAELEQAEDPRRGEIGEQRDRRRAALDATLERLRREDHPGQLEALEERLGGLDTEQRVRGIESRIDALEVDDRVEALEERIRRLQVRERGAALRRRLRHARDRLEDLRRRLEPRIERLAPG